MSHLAIAVRALVKATWRAGFNRGWRFSPAKSGLWQGVAQVGVAALALWRLGGSQAPGGAVPWLLALGAAQAGLFTCLTLFLRGRQQFFAGPVVQLVHLSSSPAWAPILAEVLGGLPRRAWSGLLFTVALSQALPSGSHLWAVPALWLAVVLGGLLGHLTGLVALIAWVRLWPRALDGAWFAGMLATLAFVYYTLYLLIVGVDLGALTAALQRVGRWLPILLGLLFGLPGLWLISSPRRAGAAYRQGWLRLIELGDGSNSPRRSRFPRLAPGPAGAVQALVWLMALRNWVSLLRIILLIAGIGGIILAGPVLRQVPAERLPLLIIGLGLGMALLNYGEQAGALFSANGPRTALFALAGVRPGQLLLGKWLASLPLAVAGALTTAATALITEQGLVALLGYAGLTGLILLGAITWLVGATAFDAAPREGIGEDAPAQIANAFEQIPSRLGGIAGIVGAVGVAGAALWLSVTHPLWLSVLALVPLGALLTGFLWLRHLLRRGLAGTR